MKSKIRTITSTLQHVGESDALTAMAKTVGLPMGIAAKLILNREVKLKGVIVPVQKELYQPMLNELATYGIRFREKLK